LIADVITTASRTIGGFIETFDREYKRIGLVEDVDAALLVAREAMKLYNDAERFAGERRGRRAAYGWAMAVVRVRRLAYSRAIRSHFEATEALRKIDPVYYDE